MQTRLRPAEKSWLRRRSGAKQCENVGATLAVISDGSENQFVLDVLENALFEKPNAYAPYGWIAQSQSFSNVTNRTLGADSGRFGTVLWAARKVCGCAFMYPAASLLYMNGRSWDILMAVAAMHVQLLVSALLAVRTRPRGDFSALTNYYFALATITNVGHIWI